ESNDRGLSSRHRTGDRWCLGLSVSLVQWRRVEKVPVRFGGWQQERGRRRGDCPALLSMEAGKLRNIRVGDDAFAAVRGRARGIVLLVIVGFGLGRLDNVGRLLAASTGLLVGMVLL